MAIVYYVDLNIPLLQEKRGFKSTDVITLLDPNNGLKIKELLIPVEKQNINIRAKAESALLLGKISHFYAKTRDYSLTIKYLDSAINQSCDLEIKKDAKDLVKTTELKGRILTTRDVRSGEGIEPESFGENCRKLDEMED